MALLNGYRAIDLTEGGCMLSGQMLGDLGVEVIKVEPPGGSPSRNIGPFYKNIADPQKSLFWFAYNGGKRSITLNLQSADGRDIFRKLVPTADFIVDTFSPGHWAELGLSYPVMSRINPRLVLTSITWYGQTGPKSLYKGCDLAVWASGGELHASGDADRAPNWLSFPQTSLHGGAYAAAATMVAHWHRELTGEGQSLDVSIQEIVPFLPEAFTTPAWDLAKWEIPRAGLKYIFPNGVCLSMGFPCRDGYICMYVLGGDVTMLDSSKALQAWIVEEGRAPEWFKAFDWETEYNANNMTQETVDRVENLIIEFFKTKTKREIYDAAMERRILAAPVSTAKDVSEDRQLAARDFWVAVEHPELQDTIDYGSYPIKISDPSGIQTRGRAPLIGEHNEDIYVKELGLSKSDMVMLVQAGII
jgi:crotonobetainyl-CoA:carnitine CoA-transferase CaiB-like acyl-CoA transferase